MKKKSNALNQRRRSLENRKKERKKEGKKEKTKYANENDVEKVKGADWPDGLTASVMDSPAWVTSPLP